MDKLNLDNFDWGWMNHLVMAEDNSGHIVHIKNDGTEIPINEYHKQSMIKEIFEDKCYETFFEVEKGDLVVDVGASLGPFTYSIIHKQPKHVFCFEPSEKEFKTLVKNLMGFPATTINKGISNVNSIVDSNKLFGGENKMETITFKKFIDLYGIEKIDFLKTDCEGGEYDIFNDENFDYILNNVKKISGEWHLSDPDLKNKFFKFRETYLSNFNNYSVNSVDGVDIKWELYHEGFIEYYNEVIINIDNRN